MATLAENFKGTQFSNPRYENGKLTSDADFQEGFREVEIFPSSKLLNNVWNYGFDQNPFVRQEMDWH